MAGRPKQSARRAEATAALRAEWAGRVRALRAELDMTQADLAERVGVTAHRVRHWEAARSVPDESEQTTIRRLAGEE